MSDFIDNVHQYRRSYQDGEPRSPPEPPETTRISIPVSFVQSPDVSRSVYEIPIHRARSTSDIDSPQDSGRQPPCSQFQPLAPMPQQWPLPSDFTAPYDSSGHQPYFHSQHPQSQFQQVPYGTSQYPSSYNNQYRDPFERNFGEPFGPYFQHHDQPSYGMPPYSSHLRQQRQPFYEPMPSQHNWQRNYNQSLNPASNTPYLEQPHFPARMRHAVSQGLSYHDTTSEM
ncbi:hypothetical protein ACOME3_007138 [Neoechinorhynchus agilis]